MPAFPLHSRSRRRGVSVRRSAVVAGLLSMVVGLLALLFTAPLGSAPITALCLVPIGAGGSLAMPPAEGSAGAVEVVQG